MECVGRSRFSIVKISEWIDPTFHRDLIVEQTDAIRLCTCADGWVEQFGVDVLISHKTDTALERLKLEFSLWALNVDSIIVSILLGFVGLGFIWWIVRGATSGVPTKRQAFVELLIDFVDEQAKGIFHHGDRNRFIAPLALTVFVWVVLMNAMDFLPAELVGLVTQHISEHGFRYVPTADVNTTFALSISVLILTIFFSISVNFSQNSFASSHETFSTGKSSVFAGTLSFPPPGSTPYFSPSLPLPSREK